MNEPLFTDDTIVFGLLTLCLGFVFFTSGLQKGFWKQFYNWVPVVLMCYLLPAILTSLGVISEEHSRLYFVASRYLLPAALVLMTLSIDLKAIRNLGPKALIMFLTGSLGIILGGPLAILIVSAVAPEIVGGVGFDAVWRGLATIAGSWIGGGANQAAMLEVFRFNPERFGEMVLVDIVCANIWMAVLLFGIGKSDKIDRWLKADASSIETLKVKVSSFSERITRVPTLRDYMLLLFIAFSAVGLAHFGGGVLSNVLQSNLDQINNPSHFLSFLGGEFFWMVVLATALGIGLSFTPARNFEGAGASKIGSVFVYILVATIGMQMDLNRLLENPGLVLVGLLWIAIHAALLILVAKWIKAPFFFLAVGSQANVGGAASAPIVAAEFHPALSSVGVLLAVLGYVVGTGGALLCAYLMSWVAPI